MNTRLLWTATGISLLAVPAYLSPATSKLLHFTQQQGTAMTEQLAGKPVAASQALPGRPVAASQPQLSEYSPQR